MDKTPSVSYDKNRLKHGGVKVEKKERKQRSPGSLNRKLIGLILIFWIVPLVIIFTFMTFSYRRGMMEKTDKLLNDELNNVSSFLSLRINEAISLSQRPTYERVGETAWELYRKGSITRTDLSRRIDTSLKGKFYIDKKFDMSAFYLRGARTPLCYSSRSGISMNEFMEEADNEVQKIAAQDSSEAHVRVINGGVYIIRNMYTTTNYKKFGTLVVRLNNDKLLQGISPGMDSEVLVCINQTDSLISSRSSEQGEAKKEITDKVLKSYNTSVRSRYIDTSSLNYKGMMLEKKYDDYHMGVIFLVEKQQIYSELYDFYRVIALVVLLMIPVIIYVIFFLKRQISKPIGLMVNASKTMMEGRFGTVVEGEQMPNEEFNYLMESFNQMSRQVEYLFDYAYDEKMARKDAKIMALQAQINPHFLNNTLEMMNWQARMSGDITVCKMIEALGTVMDYRMNRDNRSLINLAEELRCADAYFYIISMRFGKRLTLEKDIDESLLQTRVPQLILQPILENAVVHGIEQVKTGTIEIHIFHEEEFIYITVVNSGKPMTEADQERIHKILTSDPSEIEKGRGQHTSLGIRNVNERIKLIYGEQYGLSIDPLPDGKTRSTICLPYEQQEEDNREAEKIKAQKELKNMSRH